MSRAERLFGLAQFLQTKSGRTMLQITERFEVSQRTAFRDLAALQEAGLPIEFADGRYRIHDAQPPPLNLDSGELTIVHVALSNPDLVGGKGPLSRAIQKLRAKLEEAMSSRKSPR
ncbi:MAG TPA: HTH domain-containing protein [Thermoanaerobaculia bacterium]|nr:HTH domain-containing protein [Thermoanaerobaculia bacterium]